MKQDRHKPHAPPTDWSDAADWYDQLVGEGGSEYHQHVVLPGALRLLALEPGQRALDVACGQGVLCRLLQSRGIQTTGIDASAELIRLARKRAIAQPIAAQSVPAPSPDVAYRVADARQLGFLPASHFHAAACLLAIQNIQPFQPVLTGVARVLNPRGRLVLVMMHPCFRGPKYSSWGWDEPAAAQYRRVERYLLPRKEPIITHPGKDPGKYTWTFHRPLGAYVKAMHQAGLLVDALEEWPSHKTSAPGPRSAAENTARREIPMFLAIRAVNMAGGTEVP